MELYKEPKTNTKKEHIRLVTVSIGIDVVAKTDDEIDVLSIMKLYNFHLFSLMCQKTPSC